jgi:hypothetical protein
MLSKDFKYINNTQNYLVLILVTTLFSYQTVTPLAVMSDVSSSKVNLFIKMLTAISFFLILIKLLRKKISFKSRDLIIILLLTLYSVRLFVDLFFYNISYEHSTNSYILSYFFILTVIPVVCLVISGGFTKYRKLNLLALIFIAAINILHILVLRSSGVGIVESFAGRMSVLSEGSSEKSIISPLTISLYGCIGINYALFKLFFYNLPVRHVILYLILLLIGATNLFLGASRGPMLITIGLATITLFKFLRQFSFRVGSFVRAVLLLIIFLTTSYLLTPYIEKIDFFLIDRIVHFFDGNNSSEVRNVIQESAINDFLSNPLLGSHFLDSTYGSFPHNAVIDALMACGLLGGALMVLLFFRFTFCLILFTCKRLCKDYELFFIYAAPFVLFGLTSGSMVLTPTFWIILAILSGKVQRRNIEIADR